MPQTTTPSNQGAQPARQAGTPSAALHTPFHLGSITLPNRIVMAPLTRARADRRGVPSPLAPLYYSQRASAGLIIAEATTVSLQAVGYDGGPGIYTEEQVTAWRAVTDAVHAAGGRIFLQLFHAGRMSHPVFHNGEPPVGPSAIAAGPNHELYDNAHTFARPRPLAPEELPDIVDQFRRASRNALEAGFDGVEVHAANGYLLDQFLRTASNQRTDAYGGSAENRTRLTREVTEAVIEVWGADRVGVRISPLTPTNGMTDDDPHETFGHVAGVLDDLGVAYLHVIEPGVNGTLSQAPSTTSPDLGSGHFRHRFSGPIIAAGGHDALTGEARLGTGDADLIAYGKPYIANPDLPERFAVGAPLTTPDPATFYGGGARGYTDYPTRDTSRTTTHRTGRAGTVTVPAGVWTSLLTTQTSPVQVVSEYAGAAGPIRTTAAKAAAARIERVGEQAFMGKVPSSVDSASAIRPHRSRGAVVGPTCA